MMVKRVIDNFTRASSILKSINIEELFVWVPKLMRIWRPFKLQRSWPKLLTGHIEKRGRRKKGPQKNRLLKMNKYEYLKLDPNGVLANVTLDAPFFFPYHAQS